MGGGGGLPYKEWSGKVSLRRKHLGRGLGKVRGLGIAVWGKREAKGPKLGVSWPVQGTAGGQRAGTQEMRGA